MVANRAYFGRFFADDDVTAVGALPNHVVVAGENKATLNVGQQFFVALLMVFFNLTDHCKQRGDMVETLFLGGFGESGIHVRPLVILASGGIFQVGHRVRHLAVMQKLEPNFSVFFLVGCRLFKNSGDLVVSVLLRLGSIVGIFVTRLRLARESGLQILFRL